MTEELSRDTAWTATCGYKVYPPYVNLTGNRLTIREKERDGANGDQYFIEPGRTVSIDLPDEALTEIASAIAARIESTRHD